MKLSAVLITRDEEERLGDCLKSVAFCDEIVVVDSGSRDRTVQIAESFGAKIFHRAFDDFASQKNDAMSRARGEWIFLIDADERASEELARQVRSAVQNPSADGYRVHRINNLFGRWMRHGDNRDDYPLRVVRRGRAVYEGIVHESVRLQGSESVLKGVLMHHSTPTVRAYMKKLDVYTTLEARRLKERGFRAGTSQMLLRPAAVFFRGWLFRLGFLDGREGFMYSALSAYYEFIRLAKAREVS